MFSTDVGEPTNSFIKATKIDVAPSLSLSLAVISLCRWYAAFYTVSSRRPTYNKADVVHTDLPGDLLCSIQHNQIHFVN